MAQSTPIDSAASPSKTKLTSLLAVILAVAAVFRFHGLGRSSLWIDEGTSVTLTSMPWPSFLRALWQYEANMSFYYLLLRVWRQLGDSEAMLRSFSAIAGVAGVAALYGLGRRLFGGKAGLLAATFLALSVLHMWGSQEVRSYSLLVLLVILSIDAFVRAVDAPDATWRWIGYAAAAVLAVYCHVFALLVLPVPWLALDRERWRAIGGKRAATIVAAIAVLVAPLVVFVVFRDQGQLSWIPPLSAGMVLLTVNFLVGFNLILLILMTIGLVLAVRAIGAEGQGAFALRLLGLWLLLPMAVVFVVSFVKPVFFFRYFAISLPASLLLAARALTPKSAPERPRSRPRTIALGALTAVTIAVSALSAGTWSARMVNWGGDWRGATAHVLEHRQAGDAVFFHVAPGLEAYRYYEARFEAGENQPPLPALVFPPPDGLASKHWVPEGEPLARALAAHPRVWLVLHQRKLADVPPSLLQPFRVGEQRDFSPALPEMSLTVVRMDRTP